MTSTFSKKKLRREIMKSDLKLKIDNSEEINISQFSKHYKVDRKTVRKYVNLLNSCKGINRKVRAAPSQETIKEHHSVIKEKLDDSCDQPTIFKYLSDQFHLNKKVSFSSFKNYCKKEFGYSRKNNSNEPVIRFETLPGKQAQVDWKERMKFKLKNDEVITIDIFLCKLSYSRKRFFFPVFEKTYETVVSSLIKCFKEWGGVPQEIVFDNMKTVVYDPRQSKSDDYVINKKFAMFSKDFGFRVIPCVVHRAQTKGKVERLAKDAERLRILNKTYESYVDLFVAIRKTVNQLDSEISRAHGFIPQAIFARYEKNTLQSLPFEKLIEKYDNLVGIRVVTQDCFVNFKNNRYSVPFEYVNKKIEVRPSTPENKIHIYFNNRYITSHKMIPESMIGKISYHREHIEKLAKHLYQTDELNDLQKNQLNESLVIWEQFKELENVKY